MTAATAAVFFSAGCNTSEADEPFKPPTVTFEGKVDVQYVGNWETADKRSGLNLSKDGSAKIKVVAASPSGDQKSELNGSWLASDGFLLLKYGKSGQPDTVLKYEATLKGNSMDLKQKGGRMTTHYSRK